MPVKLTVVLSGRTISRHEFKDFQRLKVGRNEDCDVFIDNLGVSRVHCEIVKKPGFVQLRDMQSGNGTFVNGKQITTYNLNSGDLISLGERHARRFGLPDLAGTESVGRRPGMIGDTIDVERVAVHPARIVVLVAPGDLDLILSRRAVPGVARRRLDSHRTLVTHAEVRRIATSAVRAGYVAARKR